jgi:hypothetical protein
LPAVGTPAGRLGVGCLAGGVLAGENPPANELAAGDLFGWLFWLEGEGDGVLLATASWRIGFAGSSLDTRLEGGVCVVPRRWEEGGVGAAVRTSLGLHVCVLVCVVNFA